MKIVYVIGGLYRGGIENWFLNMSKALMARGHDVQIINATGKGDMQPLFAAAGVPVCNMGKVDLPLGTHRIDSTLKLRRLLQQFAPDVVQSMHYSANYHTRLAAIGLKMPVITNLRNVTRETKPLRRLANKLLSYRSTCFVSVAQAVADVVAEDHNIAGRPSHLIYNGIPETHFSAPAADISALNLGAEETPILINACRLTRVKNIPFFLRAFRRIVNELPNAKYLLMGDGGQRAELEALTRELHLENSVIFMGMRSDVPNVLRALAQRRALFALPSLWEGCPNSALEALACGIPLVAADTVPIKEITGTSAAILPLDESIWAQECTRLLQAPQELARMKQEGLALAESLRFSKHVDTWLKLYGEVIEEYNKGK